MEIDAFAQRFQEGVERMDGMSLDKARPHYDALCASFAPPLPPGMQLKDACLDGVAVRHHRPADARSGSVVYVHGGGFSLGSLDSHQGVASGLADALQINVISVDYRRLPEASYTDALDDIRRVIQASSPCVLVGDSAGATLILDLDDLSSDIPLGLVYPLVGQPDADSLGPDAQLLSRAEVLEIATLVGTPEYSRDATLPPSRSLEMLAVERDPLTAPLETAIATWRDAGVQVGYTLAADMLHGCLHARESLPEMRRAWKEFCCALSRHIR